jgi:hypothetical protein
VFGFYFRLEVAVAPITTQVAAAAAGKLKLKISQLRPAEQLVIVSVQVEQQYYTVLTAV